jgi:hypothetical protein
LTCTLTIASSFFPLAQTSNVSFSEKKTSRAHQEDKNHITSAECFQPLSPESFNSQTLCKQHEDSNFVYFYGCETLSLTQREEKWA